MKTKIVIDSEAARDFLFKTKGEKIDQKELSKLIDTSEQNLINLKNKAPKAFKTVLKIQEVTGANFDLIIKEVPDFNK